MTWLAPDPPRQVPRERAWSVALRTLHLLAFGILVGGHVWEVPAERLHAALWLTLASGAAMMGLELYKTVHWLFLGKGLAVLLKLALLLLVPLFWEARVPLLVAVVVVASVGAHMPARYRHYSLLHGRVVLEERAAPGAFGPAGRPV
jgi:hypothetical protein